VYIKDIDIIEIDIIDIDIDINRYG